MTIRTDRTRLREGKLVRWDRDKGFGFIQPVDGGMDVFVHVSAVPGNQAPAIGDRIVFSAEDDAQGRGQRALKAIIDGAPLVLERLPAKPQPSARHHRAANKDATAGPRRAERGSGLRDQTLQTVSLIGQNLAVAAATLFCLWGAVTTVPVSPIPLLAYPVFSLVAFVLYARDKLSAIRGTWRVRERALHLVEFAGGWPGAYLAQQTMRHKTAKQSYQTVFWLLISIHLCFWTLWIFAPDTVRPFFTLDHLRRLIGTATHHPSAGGMIEWSR